MKGTDSEKQYHRMVESPIPKLIVSLAIPTVIGMLITVIYNTADTYFVSQINASASAAVGAVYPLMAIIQAIGYGIGMGAGSIISRLLGKKENDAADRFASSAFFFALLMGGLILALGLVFSEPFLRLLGCSETMLPYAMPYALYILLVAPISCTSFVLSNILRAEGASLLSMIGMGIGGVLNLALDPILIFACGLLTGGAALATAISQTVSFLIMLGMFLAGRSIVKVRVRCVSRKIGDYVQILLTGLPTICRQALGSLSAALLNVQAGLCGGDVAISAVTIANKAYVLVRNIVLGVGQGYQPVAGYNFGAERRTRTWQAFRFTTILGTAVCLVFTVLIAVFPTEIMAWFSSDDEVIRIGVQTLLFGAAVMPLMAFSTYVNQTYQCLGFKAQATFLASCRQGVFFVPAILLLPLVSGLVGVELSQPLADLLTFVVSVPFMIVFYRKEIRGRN